MGIPGLFKYICTNYPHAVKNYRKYEMKKLFSCHDLYIDTNALIHPCAQYVFQYGSAGGPKT